MKSWAFSARNLELGEETTTTELLVQIEALNEEDKIDGILIQLPLPEQSTSMPFSRPWTRAKTLTGFIRRTWDRSCSDMNHSWRAPRWA